MDTTMDRDTLGAKLLPELQQIAQTLGVEGAQKLRKAGLIDAIVAASTDGGDAPKPARAKRNGAAKPSRAGGRRDRARDDDEDETPRRATAQRRATSAPRPATIAATARIARSPTTAATRTAAATKTAAATATRTAAATKTASQGQDRNQRPRRQPGPRRRARTGSDGDSDRSRRRPSREERRRQREERRLREEAERAEEVKTAPSRTGILDILPEGYGFLRTGGYLPGPEDVYVSLSHVRKHSLRKGDTVTGKIREPKNNEKYPALLLVEAVNDMDPELASKRAAASTS